MVTMLTDQLLQQTLDDNSSLTQVYLNRNPRSYGEAMFIHPGPDVTPPRYAIQRQARDRHQRASERNHSASVTPATTSLSSPLYLNCDSATATDSVYKDFQLMFEALSPTAMPPMKRHRRSASVPGGTRSDTHTAQQRHASRHRQSTGILHPLAIRPDVSSLMTTSVTNALSTEPTQAGFCPPSRFSYGGNKDRFIGGFTFSGTNFLRPGIDSPVDLPMSLLSFNSNDATAVVSQPASIAGGICQSLLVSEHFASSSEMAAIGAADAAPPRTTPPTCSSLTPRCRSQPGALLSRAGSLKRRREECRPRLDFLKMRQTAYYDDSISENCMYSQSNTLLSTVSAESILPDNPSSSNSSHADQTTDSWYRPCKETRRSTTPVIDSTVTINTSAAEHCIVSAPSTRDSENSITAPDDDTALPTSTVSVIADVHCVPPECSSSSCDDDDVDEELAAINDARKNPMLELASNPGSESLLLDDEELDLELIERN